VKDGLGRMVQALAAWSLFARSLLLIATACLISALLVPVAYSQHGVDGVKACVIAGSICLFGGLSAMTVSDTLPGPDLAIANLLFTIFLRLGIPIGICVFVFAMGDRLVDAGLVYYLIVFYPVLLLLETAFSVGQVAMPAQQSE